MAPVKRGRNDGDGDDVDILDIASSSLRRDPPKRPRLSRAEEDHDGDESDILHNNGNGEDPSTQVARRGVRQDYEARRDRTDGDSDDDAALEQATQTVLGEHHLTAENAPAEAGVIQSVECTNFMCHGRLTVDLGPLINFIIGHNGSGKSAVLTAITLCLGGKATSTNRGQNLKSFVKEGEENCVLRVKIKNQGITAFKSDIYGESIIIERHFSICGSSSFKIKSANNKIISTKRAELDDISDYYALQLDNPVNVLTQDMARQFLNNSTPSDKYRFFVKGVQLEQLDNDYTILCDSLDLVDTQMEHIDEGCKVLKDEAMKAEAKLRASDRQETLREKIRKYGRQMAWAQVEEQERKLEGVERAVQSANEKIERKKQDAIVFEEAYEQANNAHVEAEAIPAQLLREIEPLRETQTQAKSAFDSQKQELLQTQSSERDLKAMLDAVLQRMRKTEADINAERQRLESADGGSHAAKLTEIDNAQKKLLEIQSQRDEHSIGLAQLEQAKVNGEKKTAQVVGPQVHRKRNDIQQAQEKMNALQQHRGNQMAAFYANLPNLLRALESDQRFREKPVGPMALHVTLLKPEWSSIVESTLGGVLNSFVVTSKRDASLLGDVMRRTRCVYPVYIGNSRPIDTAPLEPDPLYDTLMRVLNIDNDLVRNQLIINQNIEQIILIQNRQEAYSTIFDGAKPRNVKLCLCFHGTARGQGVRMGMGRGDVMKMDPIASWTGQARMKTDIEVQLRMQQDTIDALKQEQHVLDGSLRECQNEVLKCTQDIKRHAKVTKDLQLDFQRAEDMIQQLRDDLEEATPQDGRLDELKKQLNEEEDDRETYQGQLDQSRTERDELSTVSSNQKHKLDEIDERINEFDHKIQKANKKVTKLAEKRQLALRQKNEALQQVEDAKADKVTAENEAQQMLDHVNDFKRQAEELCPRVPVPPNQTPASLDKMLDRLTEDLQRYDRVNGGDPETVARDALRTKQAYTTLKKDRDDTLALSHKLRRSLLDRHTRWRYFRSAISSRARAQFIYLLAERAFRGKMRISHEQKTLELHVEPETIRSGSRHSRSDGGRQTKTLSGGEKSFTTICLLLALWDAMGSPIRCLDEFDVFMDSVNRDVSMGMMIKAARRSVGRQYILITPQAMSGVELAMDVKIHKMNDPERGQTTLDLPRR